MGAENNGKTILIGNIPVKVFFSEKADIELRHGSPASLLTFQEALRSFLRSKRIAEQMARKEKKPVTKIIADQKIAGNFAQIQDYAMQLSLALPARIRKQKFPKTLRDMQVARKPKRRP